MLKSSQLFKPTLPDLLGSYLKGQAIRKNNEIFNANNRAIEKDNSLERIRNQVNNGDESALKRLIAKDPVAGKVFASSLNDIDIMDNNQKTNKLNEVKNMLGFLQMSPTKETHDKNRPFLINATGIDPGEFDPDKRKLLFEMSTLLNNKIVKPEKFGKARAFLNTETNQNEVLQIGEQGTKRLIPGIAPVVKSPLVNIEGDKVLSANDQLKLKVAETKAVKAAEFNAKSFQKMLDDSDSATLAANQTISLIRAQNAIKANTGPGTNILDKSRRVVVALASFVGIDPDVIKSQVKGITEISEFRAIQEKLVGSKLAAEPGVKTDGDAERMRNTLANINNPEDANKFISNLIMSESLRTRNRSKFFNEEARKGNRDTFEIRQKWNNYVETTPLIQINPTTGKAIFISQFIEDNQGKFSRNEILEGWRTYEQRTAIR